MEVTSKNPQWTTFQDFDQYVTREGPFCYCKLCPNKRDKSITNIRYHIEAKHFTGTFEYSCNVCNRFFNTRKTFRDHSKFCKRVE